MTKNLDKEGLSSIVDNYQLFYIDLWGVVHNGIILYENAISALKEITKKNKEYVLLTNAPRPNKSVKIFLEKLGMEKEIREHVYTSGEAALNYLNRNHPNDSFFHVGPPRDFDLFKEFKKNKSEEIKESEYILCTGLFDNFDKELTYYKDLLEKYIDKEMVCTNPDLIVDRGEETEYCAGSVAKVFEEIGGRVKYFGKPYPLVYEKSTNNKRRSVLCIGDNLNTDIRGANLQNFKSLFILNGIHKKENQNQLNKLFEKYQVEVNYTQEKLKW